MFHIYYNNYILRGLHESLIKLDKDVEENEIRSPSTNKVPRTKFFNIKYDMKEIYKSDKDRFNHIITSSFLSLYYQRKYDIELYYTMKEFYTLYSQVAENNEADFFAHVYINEALRNSEIYFGPYYLPNYIYHVNRRLNNRTWFDLVNEVFKILIEIRSETLEIVKSEFLMNPFKPFVNLKPDKVSIIGKDKKK